MQGASGTQQSCPSVQSAFGTSGVELIVNEKTYNKFNINSTENLEEQINNLLRTNFLRRYKIQLSYLAKFSKNVYGEEEVFKRWVKSDLNYNYSDQDTQSTRRASGASGVHNTLLQKLNKKQFEGSGFVFQEIEEVILEIDKVNDIQASSYIELPPK